MNCSLKATPFCIRYFSSQHIHHTLLSFISQSFQEIALFHQKNFYCRFLKNKSTAWTQKKDVIFFSCQLISIHRWCKNLLFQAFQKLADKVISCFILLWRTQKQQKKHTHTPCDQCNILSYNPTLPPGNSTTPRTHIHCLPAGRSLHSQRCFSQ